MRRGPHGGGRYGRAVRYARAARFPTSFGVLPARLVTLSIHANSGTFLRLASEIRSFGRDAQWVWKASAPPSPRMWDYPSVSDWERQ
jgi:hypothetical protein